MTDATAQTRLDAQASNPRAVSVRIEPKPMSRAKFQRRHDFRIGPQPAYVDGARSHLNRTLMPLRPLGEIQRENEALRRKAGRVRKMKSNAAVVTTGIITFGTEAQEVFGALSADTQDRAFTDLAHEVAARLDTSLEAMVVHLDETAIHAHFTLRAYTDAGEPISDATRPADLSALQDLAAEVMQRYAPQIERGRKKAARLQAGANYRDTLHRTVKQLHEELPQEKAALEAEIETMSQKLIEQEASVAKTQGHLAKLEAKTALTEKESKRQETYTRRLEKKQAAVAESMRQLELRQRRVAEILEREKTEIRNEKARVEAERQEARRQTQEAQAAKAAYESGVEAIEAVLSEAENETLSYDPDTGKTTMRDPEPIRRVPRKLRTQIVRLAKRLAFIENNLFTRIFRLDEQIGRVRAFLTRADIEPDERREAQGIVSEIAPDEPDP